MPLSTHDVVTTLAELSGAEYDETAADVDILEVLVPRIQELRDIETKYFAIQAIVDDTDNDGGDE